MNAALAALAALPALVLATLLGVDPRPREAPADSEIEPPRIYAGAPPIRRASIVYVLDISTSMSWDLAPYTALDGKPATGSKLDRAKAALARSIVSLPRNFRFDVIAFDCNQQEWQSRLRDAAPANVRSALAWIDALHEKGATGTGPAIARALALGDVRLVVLLTDGAPNCGAGNGWGDAECIQAHRRMIADANREGATIDVYGFGAVGELEQFCRQVAADSGGLFTPVN